MCKVEDYKEANEPGGSDLIRVANELLVKVSTLFFKICWGGGGDPEPLQFQGTSESGGGEMSQAREAR